MIALENIDVKTGQFLPAVKWELAYNKIHHPHAHEGAKLYARIFVQHPRKDTLEAYRERFKTLTEGEAVTC